MRPIPSPMPTGPCISHCLPTISSLFLHFHCQVNTYMTWYSNIQSRKHRREKVYVTSLSETGLFNMVISSCIEWVCVSLYHSRCLPIEPWLSWISLCSPGWAWTHWDYLPRVLEWKMCFNNTWHSTLSGFSMNPTSPHQLDRFLAVTFRDLSVPDFLALWLQMYNQTKLLHGCWRSMFRSSCLHVRKFTYAVPHPQLGFILWQQGW